MPGAELAAAVERLRRPGLALLAEKVETRAERGEFEACASFGIDLLEVAEAYRAALAWVEQTAPHLA